MNDSTGDWRAAARRAGHFSVAPGDADRQQKNAAFDRLRDVLVERADRVLLCGWEPGWADRVPADARPAWLASIDAAPAADAAGPPGVRLLERRWLREHTGELGVLKPRVRWTALAETGHARRESASPGEVLLEFASPALAAQALRQGGGESPLVPYVVTRGASSYFSPSTWKLLRSLGAGERGGRVLLALNEGSHSVPCFCSAASLDQLFEALDPVLRA